MLGVQPGQMFSDLHFKMANVTVTVRSMKTFYINIAHMVYSKGKEKNRKQYIHNLKYVYSSWLSLLGGETLVVWMGRSGLGSTAGGDAVISRQARESISASIWWQAAL